MDSFSGAGISIDAVVGISVGAMVGVAAGVLLSAGVLSEPVLPIAQI